MGPREVLVNVLQILVRDFTQGGEGQAIGRSIAGVATITNATRVTSGAQRGLKQRIHGMVTGVQVEQVGAKIKCGTGMHTTATGPCFEEEIAGGMLPQRQAIHALRGRQPNAVDVESTLN